MLLESVSKRSAACGRARCQPSVPGGRDRGLIGPNGAGKTTCFNMIAGVYAPMPATIVSRASASTGCGPIRSARRHRPHLPDRQAVRRAVRAGERHRRRTQSASAGVREPGTRARSSTARLGPSATSPRLLTLPERKRLEVARALATPPEAPAARRGDGRAAPDRDATRWWPSCASSTAAHGLTILLIEHVMRAVMALAQRHRAAPRRGDRARHARRGGARSGRARLYLGEEPRMSGRCCRSREPRPLLRRRAGARRRLARGAERRDRRHRRRQRRRQVPRSAPSPASRSRAADASASAAATSPGAESHRICNLGIGQVAEGRQIFPSLTVMENLEMGAMLPRARARRSRPGRGVRPLPALAERRSRPPAPCRAASSRCWRSAAA